MKEIIGTLTVTHPTVFKKDTTAPSETIPDSLKFAVEEGKTFPVLHSVDAGSGHITVNFAENIGPQGWNTWDIWHGHAEITFPMPEVDSPNRISDDAIEILKKHEGLRLAAYKCLGGIWTVGFGSTHGVERGDRITEAEALEKLRLEVQIYETGVLEALTIAPNQNQFNAMVLLAYNIGVGGFKSSSVRRFHNLGQTEQAADAFRLWNKGGGRVLGGLVKRREEERSLYLKEPEDSPQLDAEAVPDVEPSAAPDRPKSPIRVPGIGIVDLYEQIVPGIPFYWYEATHGGRRIPQTSIHADNIVALAKALGRAREQIGKPFEVTSWYRPDPWNKLAGGATRSQHKWGKAIDFKVDGETGRSLAHQLSWWPGGMGIYRNLPHIIHLDIRPNKARWGGA